MGAPAIHTLQELATTCLEAERTEAAQAFGKLFDLTHPWIALYPLLGTPNQETTLRIVRITYVRALSELRPHHTRRVLTWLLGISRQAMADYGLLPYRIYVPCGITDVDPQISLPALLAKAEDLPPSEHELLVLTAVGLNEAEIDAVLHGG